MSSRARAVAETRLNDTCTIRAPGQDLFDPDDGITHVDGTARCTCSCRLLAPDGAERRTGAGGDDRNTPHRTLLVPEAATAQVGDRVTITGRTGVLVVVAVDDRRDPILRRLTVTESVDAPAVPR